MNVDIKIKKHREKLEQMILDNEDYDKIVEQSQKLDEYINIAMKQMAEEKKS